MFRSNKPGPHFHNKQLSHDNRNPILIIQSLHVIKNCPWGTLHFNRSVSSSIHGTVKKETQMCNLYQMFKIATTSNSYQICHS